MESPSRSTPYTLEYRALSISSSDETRSETPPKNRANEDPHGHSAVRARSNLGPATILADVASILCPLALLGFSIVILQTDGREIDEIYFSYQNAITTVSCVPMTC